MKDRITYKDVTRFSWHYWRRRPLAGVALLVLMMLATAVDVFIPVYAGRIVDVLTTGAPGQASTLEDALFYLGVFAALALVFNLLRWASVSLWAWFAVQCLQEILTEAMRKVQRFSADWHANAFAGATVRKITRGMWAFDSFGDTLFMGLFTAAIIMTGMTAMLLIKVPLVGVFTAVMIVLYSAFSIWSSVCVLAPRFRKAARADTQVGAELADIITGNATVKAFGTEQREAMLFTDTAKNWRLLSQNAWLTGEAFNLLRGILRAVMLVGMVGVTIWLWSHGNATTGDIALALTSSFIIGGYLRDIGMHIANVQKAVNDMEDVIDFWKRDVEVADIPGASAFAPGDGEIVFDRVKFVYNGQVKPVYDDFDIRIAPGEKVALVGPSGSGKSTFVKLVQRLYDVQGGEIRIDGQNIAHVRQASLRQAIALVPQEPVLFHRSLAANIAYGKPDATMEEIVDAARKAYADEFIHQLPLGYDTLVGERGVKLSGGERQRVAIARAILSGAPILILDEATSALDSVSEHYIQKALAVLTRNRTTITIAHRLATIKAVDRILVFDQGRVVEQGTHAALLSRDGSLYRTLFDMQALDLVGDDYYEEERAAE